MKAFTHYQTTYESFHGANQAFDQPSRFRMTNEQVDSRDIGAIEVQNRDIAKMVDVSISLAII
jgi:hypothetical protein